MLINKGRRRARALGHRSTQELSKGNLFANLNHADQWPDEHRTASSTVLERLQMITPAGWLWGVRPVTAGSSRFPVGCPNASSRLKCSQRDATGGLQRIYAVGASLPIP